MGSEMCIRDSFYIHDKTGNVYYVGSIKLDCTNSRGGHESGRMMVVYGPVHQEFATRVLERNTLYRNGGKLRQHIFGKPEYRCDIPIPYVRDLDEFLQNFTQMSERTIGMNNP